MKRDTRHMGPPSGRRMPRFYLVTGRQIDELIGTSVIMGSLMTLVVLAVLRLATRPLRRGGDDG